MKVVSSTVWPEKRQANAGISVGVYHAGMTNDDRNQIQEDFINDRIQVICATIAFGMGIDKSNVRFVVHYNLPKSIENFYQEIGRGGRDGLPCETVLYYNLQDIITLRRFADESGQQEINLEKLQRMQEYAEAQVCRRRILLNYFGEISDHGCNNCDVCHTPPQRFDATILVQKALSAIARVKEKIGFTTTIDILRGTLSPDVVSNKYAYIRTFGAGKDISARDWHDYLLQMLQMGYFEIAYNEDRHLHITTLGQEVLKGQRKVELAVINREDFSVQAQKKKVLQELMPQAEGQSGENKKLFNLLRGVRTRIAKEQGKPPYIIMQDRSLHELAIHMPTTLEAFADIYGIGRYKAGLYGQQFIDVIKQYALDASDLPFPEAGTTKIEESKPSSYMDEQKQQHPNAYAKWSKEDEAQLVKYYVEGKSIDEIAILMQRNVGGIKSRLRLLGILDKKEEKQEQQPESKIAWFNDYEDELLALMTQKAELEEKIQRIRETILQQMELHQTDIIESPKFTINYVPSRITMQFDSKAFKEANEDLYSSYCTPNKRKAIIVIKQNKE